MPFINSKVNVKTTLKQRQEIKERLGKAISIIPTPPEPEEQNRNARYRNPNVSLADLIKANSQY